MSRQIWVGMAISLLLLALVMLACQAAPESTEQTVAVIEGVTRVAEQVVEKEVTQVVEPPPAEPEQVTLWSWAYNDFEVWALKTLSERVSASEQLQVELDYVQ